MVKLFILISLMLSTAYAETRNKIVIIDTGVGVRQSKMPYMCKNGILTTMKDNGIDTHGHGINIIGLIAKKMDRKKYCIVSIKFHPGKPTISGQQALENLLIALESAYRLNASVVNLSLNGQIPDLNEFAKIMKLLRNGTLVNVAAGNDRITLSKTDCRAYPACYKNNIPSSLLPQFRVIGAHDTKESNRGEIVDAYLTGYKVGFPVLSGTSQATAVFTSQLVSP